MMDPKIFRKYADIITEAEVGHGNGKEQLMKAMAELQNAIKHYDTAEAENNFDYVDECLGYAINAIGEAGWDIDRLRDIG